MSTRRDLSAFDRVNPAYAFDQRIGDRDSGIVVLVSKYGAQWFTKRKARKRSKCAACREPIKVGDVVFGEMTSCAMNRMHRICSACVDAGERARSQTPLGAR